jgi:membrane protein implicated in regulation of membrane protease activity
MEGFAAAVIAIAIVLGLLFALVLMVFCLVHISTDDEVRFLPRWAWAIVVVCVSPLGGLAFLLSQHLRPRSPAARLAERLRRAAGAR